MAKKYVGLQKYKCNDCGGEFITIKELTGSLNPSCPYCQCYMTQLIAEDNDISYDVIDDFFFNN